MRCPPTRRCRWCHVVSCSVFIASAFFLFGYDVGSSNGVKEMDGFRVYFNLSRDSEENTTISTYYDEEETNVLLGLIVSMFSAGSLIGVLLGGPLSDWGGRKTALICGAFLCATGIIVQSASVFIWMLLIAKIWTGLGNGVLSQVIGLYIAELSPKHLRGKLVSMLSTAAAVGIIVASLVNLGVERLAFGWRVSLGLQFLLACILIIGSPLIPESPRWHVKKNKPEKALKTLRKIYGSNEEASRNLEEISCSFQKSQYGKRRCEVCFSWDFVHRLFLGFCVMFFARVTGIQLAVYFSVAMFRQVGLTGYVGGLLVGVATFLAQLSLPLMADKVGRKITLLCGYLVMGGCLLTASVLILAFDLESELTSTERTVAGYFVVIFLSLFMGVAVISASSQSNIVVSEIFPLKTRGMAVSLAMVGYWSGNILTGEVAPFLLSSLGTAWTLILHAGICALVVIFVLLLLPETKQISLEEVDQLFSTPWIRRTNPLFYLTCGRINRAKVVTLHRSSSELEQLDISLEEIVTEVELNRETLEHDRTV